MERPEFTMGIEEEYLLVDRDSRALGVAPEGFIEACREDLQDQVSPEYKKCQVEIGTRVCQTVGAARDDLRRLRAAISRHAADYGLVPIAASCHPFSDWKTQHHTDKERYRGLERDLAGVARRLLICGCHVHIGVADNALRTDLLRQMPYFLPHLLALSTSSPFWQGQDTGLASYRISVFDNLPRTGLPPDYQSWAELQRSVAVLVDLGIIEDSSKIWWDIRPSHHYPTLETRIMDVSPRVEDALALAAVTQSRAADAVAPARAQPALAHLRPVPRRREPLARAALRGHRGAHRLRRERDRALPPAHGRARRDDQRGRRRARMPGRGGAREDHRGGTARRRSASARSPPRRSPAGADQDAAMTAVVDHLIEEYHQDL